MEATKKKYGILSGMAMVVGVVIGCGIFIKSSSVLRDSGGNLIISLCAWLVGGLAMITGGFCFAKYANKVSKFNGIVDYVEHATGSHRFTYYAAYFFALLYFPIIGSSVAIIAAGYFCELCGVDPMLASSNWIVYLSAFLFITIFTLLNYFAPRIANRFQVSIMFVKLFPIILIVVCGIFAPFIVGNGHSIIDAFIHPAESTSGEALVVNFGEAVKTTTFVYDGWICAAALNAEMKDPKKDLPKVFVGGTIAVLLFYLIYFISLSAVLGNTEVVAQREFAPIAAFIAILGKGGSIFFTLFIFLSCFGNVNAMTLCISRGLIAIAARDEGFFPERIREIKNDKFSFPPYLITFVMMSFYVLIWFLINNEIAFFGYLQSIDEVVCSLIYIFFIIIYVYMIRHFTHLNFFSRYVMPTIAIIGSLFFIFCGIGLYQLIANHDVSSLITFGVFLIFALIIFIPGIIVFETKPRQKIQNKL